jgi:hypothetical protein
MTGACPAKGITTGFLFSAGSEIFPLELLDPAVSEDRADCCANTASKENDRKKNPITSKCLKMWAMIIARVKNADFEITSIKDESSRDFVPRDFK